MNKIIKSISIAIIGFGIIAGSMMLSNTMAKQVEESKYNDLTLIKVNTLKDRDVESIVLKDKTRQGLELKFYFYAKKEEIVKLSNCDFKYNYASDKLVVTMENGELFE